MNLFILKYGILIVSLLTTTAFVSSTLNPHSAQSTDLNGTAIDSQSIFAFGSQVFYREVAKPGNEYMQSGVEGYSQNLVPTDAEDKNYTTSWQVGVAKFESGYTRCTSALITLTSVPVMQTTAEKTAVCEEFRTGENEMSQSKNDFLAAKASASPATASGFTVAMVLERVDEIIASSDDADQACMKAVLADHNHDPADFSSNLKDTESAVQEMRRIYPELQVLSSDFT
jgi:predicted secreted protein